ncbi:MAG: hypothetical protein U1E58_01950 [Tabrizicola sp.]
MKVVENTPDRLVLRDIPLGPGLLLLAFALLPMLWGWALFRAGEAKGGFILIGIGLILFFGCFGVFVKVQRITLDRSRDLAEITETGVLGRSRKAHVLKDLHGATLQSMVIRRKPGDLAEKGRIGYKLTPEPRVWRAALVHRNGHPVPLSEVYGSEKTARIAAAAINTWFGSPEAA